MEYNYLGEGGMTFMNYHLLQPSLSPFYYKNPLPGVVDVLGQPDRETCNS